MAADWEATARAAAGRVGASPNIKHKRKTAALFRAPVAAPVQLQVQAPEQTPETTQ